MMKKQILLALASFGMITGCYAKDDGAFTCGFVSGAMAQSFPPVTYPVIGAFSFIAIANSGSHSSIDWLELACGFGTGVATVAGLQLLILWPLLKVSLAGVNGVVAGLERIVQ